MMKIAILSCFYPYRGGIAQFNAQLFEELRKNYNVKAFNFSRQYPDFLFPGKTQYVEKDDEATVIESEAVLDTANPFSYISAARKIRKWGPDLLIMRYWMSYFAPSEGYIAGVLGKKCKVISIVDNVIPHEQRFFDKPFTKYFLKRNDAFITLCDAVRNDLLSLRPDAVCKVIPHPLYTHFGEKMNRIEAEKSLGLAKEGKNILFFGLIREYKGLDILIKAFSLLDSSFNLIIAGEPYGSFEHYQKLIDESPNRERIHHFNGYIKDSEVSRFFSAADVVVLPYRSATQSGISAISYHFEVPMITTDVGGLRETIADKGTGIVVEKNDPETIASAIVSFFSDSNARKRFEECIRAEKERLSWARFCSELIEFSKTIKK